MEQGREVYYLTAPVVGVVVDPVEDTEDAIIIGQLQEINLKLDAVISNLTSIDGHLSSLLKKLGDVDTDVYNVGVAVEDLYDLQYSHNDSVRGYLDIFLNLFITVLAVVVFVRLARWIEWLFCDG